MTEPKMVTPLPKKKRPKKKSTPMDLCDKYCSLIVRARGNCEKCGSPHNLQWAHGIPRGYHATRWLMDNGFCLCRGCHYYLDLHPIEKEEWLLERHGHERYWQLRALAQAGPTVKPKDVLPELKAAWEAIEAAA